MPHFSQFAVFPSVYHLGKLVLLPNFGEVAFCRKRLTGLPSDDQNAMLWGCPLCALHRSFSFGKLTPVSSPGGVADPGPSSLQALSCVEATGARLARLGHNVTFCKAFAGRMPGPLVGEVGIWGWWLWGSGSQVCCWPGVKWGQFLILLAEPSEGSKVHVGLLASGAGSRGSWLRGSSCLEADDGLLLIRARVQGSLDYCQPCGVQNLGPGCRSGTGISLLVDEATARGSCECDCGWVRMVLEWSPVHLLARPGPGVPGGRALGVLGAPSWHIRVQDEL